MLGRVVVAVTALSLLAACGSGSERPVDPESTAASPDPGPAVTSPDPTLPEPSTGTATTLTGRVGEADENRCVTLTTTGATRTTWVLVGSTAGIAAGTTVTVRGNPAPDLATRCQQGTPFVVEAVEPG